MENYERYEYFNEEYVVQDEDFEVVCTENTFEDCLILEVQSNQILYDLTNADYNNQRKKDAVWLNIAENCGRPVIECKKRWKSLRDRFRAVYSKDSNTVSGQATSSKKVDWQYYNALKFLIPTICQAPAFSNYSENDSFSMQNTPAKTKNVKRKKDDLEEHLLQYLRAPDVEEEIDSNKNFVLSLIEPLKNLSKRKNALARIKMQQVLFDLQYEDDTS